MSTIYKQLLKESSNISTGLMYGIINSVMLIPVTISFCSIIYRDQGFESYLPQLVKLVLFSSMIHQWAFTYFSSLPFAIGQVQDAGLIFLSSMAADIVQGCARTEQIVPTTIVVLPICTFILGCLLVLVARLKLATVIQYLPMPVIGGYLAFIGFFCGQAGLAMMAGVQVTSILDWGQFCSARALLLLAPGVVFGVTTYLLLCRIRSPYVLPCCMVGILTLFFATLLLSGASLQDARDYGWISPLSHPEPFYQSWELYNFSLVDWSQLPQQSLRLLGMFLVVAFSSSLDVAAIEMEMGLPLDYNKELMTVGVANVFSGLTGGYTGSYIFSQTVFTMRRGVYTRLNGYVVVLCEGLMIMLPISIISYLPKLFFGSLLVLISTDLMCEWLWAARHKMAPMEFAVCLLTFVAIQATGIEVGMFIGILLAMACFVASYAGAQTVSTAALQTSTVIRTFDERATLIAHRGKIVTITLKGYIFFGSAVRILEDVKGHVTISVPELTPQQLMQLQEQQQRAAMKNAATVGSAGAAGDEPNETSALLAKHPSSGQQRGARSYSGDSVPDQPALKPDGRKMSFRVSANGKNTSPQHGVTSVRKLFPEVGADSVGDAHPAHSTPSPQQHIRSTSMAASLSSVHAVSLSVYEMSPQTLKRAIEERRAEVDDAPYGAFTSAREVCTGAQCQASSLPPQLPVSMTATQAGKTGRSNGSTAGVGGQISAISLPASSEGDIELGVAGHGNGSSNGSGVAADGLYSPGGRSLLTETLAASAEKDQNPSQRVGEEEAPTRKESFRQHPFRRQSGQNKVPSDTADGSSGGAAEGEAPARSLRGNRKVSFDGEDGLSRGSGGGAGAGKGESLLAAVFEQQRHRRHSHLAAGHTAAAAAGVGDKAEERDEEEGEAVMTEYLILDFTRVVGVDATATRSCFLMMVQLMRSANVTVVFANMSPSLEALFRAHKVIGAQDVVIPLLDDALEWCEERVLISAGHRRPSVESQSPSSRAHADTYPYDAALLRSHSFYSRAAQKRQQVVASKRVLSDNELARLAAADNAPQSPPRLTNPLQLQPPNNGDALRTILEDYLEVDCAENPRLKALLRGDVLVKYFRRVSCPMLEILYDTNEPADQIYFIESGEVEIVTVSPRDPTIAPTITSPSTHPTVDGSVLDAAVDGQNGEVTVVRINKVQAGGAFGEADFLLGRNRSTQAHTMSRSVFWTLDREQYARMEVEAPSLCLLIQHSLLKSLAIASTCALYARHPADASSPTAGV